MFHRFCTIIYFLIFYWCSFSQNNNASTKNSLKQIEILNANYLKYNKAIDANRLIGNVICKHENTLFYCDSAYLYPNQSLEAFGNIRIVSDSLNITAQHLNYKASDKIASLEKNVVCNDNRIQLKTEILQYNLSTKTAYYPDKAIIIRNEHELTSDKGYYYSTTKTLGFKNNVVLKNPDYTIKTDTLFYYTTTDIAHFNAPTIILMDKDYLYCEKGWYDTKNKKAYFSSHPMIFSDNKKLYADSMYYDEQNNIGYAFHNVQLIDTSQKSIITGQWAKYNRTNETALITQHPVLRKIQDKKDTIFLTTDTLYYEKQDSHIVAKCLHNSQLFHYQFQAIAEKILYYEKDSVIHLIGQPKFWFDKNQASCKQARIYLKNNTIDKIILDTNVIIVQEADTIYHNKFHQIAGRKMLIQFYQDSIKTITVEGNAQVYYFTQNEEKKWTGLNKAKCSKIRVDFMNNEIEKIVFIDHPESFLIPIKRVQVEKEKLPDFQWQPKLRPQRKNFL